MSIPDFSSENVQHSEQAVESETRSAALNRIREGENERLVLEVAVRKRLMWLGIVVGATVGLSVGYMATLVTIVDGGIDDFGFSFYRPNFVHGFLRIITAYILGGGFVGGAISYVLFTSRTEATSPIRWIIGGINVWTRNAIVDWIPTSIYALDFRGFHRRSAASPLALSIR